MEKVLPCGCVIEEINGKHITILCEEHEEDFQNVAQFEKFTPKTKMRTDREI